MSEKKSAKDFLESIKALSSGVKVAPTPAAQAALDNIEIRITQFEENLKNPLPTYLFDGQSAVLADLRKKRDGLIAGTISIEAAMSVEPLPAEPVADPLLTEVLAQAVATPSTVKETPVVTDSATESSAKSEAPVGCDSAAETPEASDVNASQIDSEWLAALVARIRSTVVEQVVAEAARLVIEAKRDALREAIIRVKTEMQNVAE